MLGRGGVVVTCAALMATGHLSVFSATAAETEQCGRIAPSLRYLVLFDEGTPEKPAAGEVAAACGAMTVYYPEIAVGVATSASPKFTRLLGPERAFSARGERLSHHRPGAPFGDDIMDISHIPDPPHHAAATEVPATDRRGEQWAMRVINADAARSVESGSRDVVVGVLDSGIDARHPDLAAAVDPEMSAGCVSGAPERSAAAWAPTNSAHGTHVAGILAAADDGTGITGVAPGVRLASVKVIDGQGYVTPEAAVCGLLWAARHGMAVANSSFLVAPWPVSCTPGRRRAVVHEAVARAVEYADRQGTLVVAAATNEGARLTPSRPSGSARPESEDTCEALPAGLREVVAVSAIGHTRMKAAYSSYGLGVVDLTGPGGDRGYCVLSTVPGGYAPMCGTSMATPHVAGVAALVASQHPGSTPRQLRALLGEQATPLACPADYDVTGNGTQDAYCAGYTGYNSFYGRGLVDAFAAVSAGQPSA